MRSLCCILALWLLVLGTGASGAGEAASDAAPVDERDGGPRIVSLNPSLTETLIALGAGSTLVGVDEFSARQQPEVRELPTVGGLFNPSLEAVVALSPDTVVIVPSAEQRDLVGRLGALGIEVVALPNIELEELLASIEQLGRVAGCEPAARARVAGIRREWRRVEEARAGLPVLRTVLVLQRDPLFVVGRGSFLDSMLRAAGAENPAAVFEEAYPRVSLEWLLATAPEVILDASDDPTDPASYWARWPSLPAVASGRVVALPAREVTMPGPYLERGLKLLADAIDGAASR